MIAKKINVSCVHSSCHIIPRALVKIFPLSGLSRAVLLNLMVLLEWYSI